MEKGELVQFARDCASKSLDLYGLLEVDAATVTDKDVHRAWKKLALKHHPDKAGDTFDATKYELLERARDVLTDAAAREAYDQARSAALHRARQAELLQGKRRRLKEELEAAERAGKRVKEEAVERNVEMDKERARMAEMGRRRMAERERLIREAEERERRREAESRKKAAEEEEEQQQQERTGATASETNGADDEVTATPGASAQAHAPKMDDYDSRVAELERRLREAQEAKARRKMEKKATRKSGVHLDTPKTSADGGAGGGTEPTAGTPSKPTSDPREKELKADDKKRFTFTPPVSSSAATTTDKGTRFDIPSSASSTPSKPSGGGTGYTATPRWQSTVARLKAAEAERQEKRRRAAEEAAASAAAATPAAAVPQ